MTSIHNPNKYSDGKCFARSFNSSTASIAYLLFRKKHSIQRSSPMLLFPIYKPIFAQGYDVAAKVSTGESLSDPWSFGVILFGDARFAGDAVPLLHWQKAQVPTGRDTRGR
jgi:hypothetical protein